MKAAGGKDVSDFGARLAHNMDATVYGAVLLVDTYDTLKSGVPNAIRVAKEVLEPMGKRLRGVRIDSGDLAYLSRKVRGMLDEIRDYVSRQLSDEIWEEEQRFVNPHRHYMDMTPDYYDMKMSLLHESLREG